MGMRIGLLRALLGPALPYWGQTTQINSKVVYPQNGTAVLKAFVAYIFNPKAGCLG